MITLAGVGYYALPKKPTTITTQATTPILKKDPIKEIPQPSVSHLKTPDPVKAIYMTSWVSGMKKWREELVQFINKTEVNALVIDVKDYSGYISFDTQDSEIKKLGTEQIRCVDLKDFIQYLHQNNIYVIARITVFQDPLYSQRVPSQAVQSKKGGVWRDKHGLGYVDPSSKPFWDYIVRLAKACEKVGFDEINFDYIRFPTDGNMKDMVFPISGPKMAKIPSKQYLQVSQDKIITLNREVSTNGSQVVTGTNPSLNTLVVSPKAILLTEFYRYLHSQMKELSIPISADLFGMVLTNTDDLNIGQVLELAAPCFDYIGPMIYPSHYPPGFKNFSKPAEHPYEIVNFVLKQGSRRLTLIGQSPNKLRPWLQDFNLGAIYDAGKINAQKKAVYDAGLNSWFMWDPRNKYTRGGYVIVPKASTSAQ